MSRAKDNLGTKCKGQILIFYISFTWSSSDYKSDTSLSGQMKQDNGKMYKGKADYLPFLLTLS